ncbi:MAG: hypothetical protein H6511_00990 [Holophagales bacterium]|nr:hypothetical protein [Holophagales bacterium]
MPRIAAFVTPHGYGHAARLGAVLAELVRRIPALELQIWTTVPRDFLEEALAPGFELVPVRVDVGVAQLTPFEEDPSATLAHLAAWEAEAAASEAEWLERLARFRPDVVVADIAPLGLELAARAGVPAVLVESFTWQWIYEPYLAGVAGLARFRERFAAATASAALRIRAEPLCDVRTPTPGEVRVGPIVRALSATPAEVRARLGLAPKDRLVAVSLGGIPFRLAGAAGWDLGDGVTIAAVGAAERARREGRVWLLPHRLGWPHRDLVGAADLVVGKLGYSTLAEAWAAGVGYLYVPRPGFRESAVLERWVAGRLPAAAVGPEALADGAWTEAARALLAAGRATPGATRGAAEAAAAIESFLPLHVGRR